MLISRRPSVFFSRRLTDLRLTLFAADLIFHRLCLFSRRLFRGSAVSCCPLSPTPSQLAVDFSTVPVHLVSKSVGTIQHNSGRLPKPTPRSIFTIAQSKFQSTQSCSPVDRPVSSLVRSCPHCLLLSTATILSLLPHSCLCQFLDIVSLLSRLRRCSFPLSLGSTLFPLTTWFSPV